MRVSTDSSTDGNELSHIQPTLPKLELRHERLPLPDAATKLSLRNAGVLSSLHEQFDYPLVEIGTK